MSSSSFVSRFFLLVGCGLVVFANSGCTTLHKSQQNNPAIDISAAIAAAKRLRQNPTPAVPLHRVGFDTKPQTKHKTNSTSCEQTSKGSNQAQEALVKSVNPRRKRVTRVVMISASASRAATQMPKKIRRKRRKRRVRRKRRRAKRKRRRARRKRRAKRKKKVVKKPRKLTTKDVLRLASRLRPVVFNPAHDKKAMSEAFAQGMRTIPMPKDRRFRWVKRKYRGRYWGFTWSILKNRGRYEKKIRGILRKLGVPEELFLLPGIESNYQVRLISPVGAVGIWQFMYKTGRRFELTVTPWIDERRNIRKATLGGGRYLRDLYRHFGKWEFAIAAYNCGRACVERALQRCPNMTFWKMRSRGCRLPWETREYVARFFAMLYYLRNPSKGRKTINPYKHQDLVKVHTPGPMSLFEVAKASGLRLRQLHTYNPELSSWATPPSQRYPLLVPPNKAALLKRYFRKPKGAYRLVSIRVAPGTPLRRIARRVGLTEREVRTFNRIWKAHVPIGRRYLILPLPPKAKRWRRTRRNNALLASLYRSVRSFRWRYPTGWRIRRRGKCHRVRRGQSMWWIARKYGMSLYRLRIYNPGVQSVRAGDMLSLRHGARCGRRRKSVHLASMAY